MPAMPVRRTKPTTLIALLVLLLTGGGLAWALSFELGETKEQLKLDYDVSVYDHGTDRVTITFTLAGEGRLAPLNSVDFHIPSKEKHADGKGYKSDLSLAMALRREAGGKQVARIHIKREWAEQGEIWLMTSTLDGKQTALGGYYHTIPLAGYVKDAVEKKR